MPRNLKRYISGTVIEISSSVEEGLPFVPTKYMELIIKGILAAAQHHSPFTLCHLVMMANHFHLLGVVENPEHVKDFIGYFKTELSHSVNRLLGREGTLFIEGSYSAVILTPHDVLKRIGYLYLNPARAGLVDSISEYPGVSTYKELLETTQSSSETWKRICRPAIPTLPQRALTSREDEALCLQLTSSAGYEYELTIEPWAWLRCFEESRYWNKATTLDDILKLIERGERQFALSRSKPPLGRDALVRQNPHRLFKSKRSGKKMLCICENIEMRAQFITDFLREQKEARLCFQQWKKGEILTHRPPPGFFLPGGLLLSNVPFLHAIL